MREGLEEEKERERLRERENERVREIFKSVRYGVFEFLFAILGEATKQGFYYGNRQGTNAAS